LEKNLRQKILIMATLHIDIETYSSVDIKASGHYKYVSSPDFEILLMAYAFGDEPVEIIDLAAGELIPNRVLNAFANAEIVKCAHNATFERQALAQYGYVIPPEQWYCTAVKAAYCGLPLSLGDVSKVLKLGDHGKMAEGKALIKYFTMPCKPTKVNGGRTRNLAEHDPDKWQLFKDYCVRDVVAEREIAKRLNHIKLPESERRNYFIDQRINDRGVEVDIRLAKAATEIDELMKERDTQRLIDITGLSNPNSNTQLTKWLEERTGGDIPSLAKASIEELKALHEEDALVSEVLNLKSRISKTSTKKYNAMLECACDDNRAYGLFQFYGANRTGRWAGRLIQLQNLVRNNIKDLILARQLVKAKDPDLLDMLFSNVPTVLSELVRTALVAKEGHALVVSDFSAIEARVLAWLAHEQWRLEVFRTHGKIYEASASKMFKVPLESIGKGSELRQRGKVAELALGYQGGVGAIRTMDTAGKLADLPDSEVKAMVDAWRRANPAITQFWEKVENAAKGAIETMSKQHTHGLLFRMKGNTLMIDLPSGRSLCYHNARLERDAYGRRKLLYEGMDQTTKQWGKVDSYGGKLVENIVQAIARDLLAEGLYRLEQEGIPVIMHVHDEVVCEVPVENAKNILEKVNKLLSNPVSWAADLPLAAEGFTTLYYKKD
jgi:DNA polymerase bacteriophage-type